MITLTVPVASPSLNKFYGQHWSKKLKSFKQWRKWIWALKQEQKCNLKALQGKRHVTIERYGGKILDHDNFVGGLKSIVDSLVAEGFLVNDSPEHVEIEYHQHLGLPHKTIIRIAGEQEWNTLKNLRQKNSSEDSATAIPPSETPSSPAIAIADACF